MGKRFEPVACEPLEPRTLFFITIPQGAPFGDDPAVIVQVFNDLNGDGVRQGKEPPLAKFPVEIVTPAGAYLQETHDDGTTGQTLTSLSNPLSVSAGAARRWRQSGVVARAQANYADFRTADTAVYDVGVTQRASVSGVIVNDLNANGSLDTGEPAARGWSVYTDDNDNGKLDTGERVARTNSVGRWSFPSLPPGHVYTIRMIARNGLSQTIPAADDAIVVSLGKGQAVKGRLFGVRAAAARGTVFNDLDGDGARDAGESPLPNWRVWVDLDNDNVQDDSEPGTASGVDGAWVLGDVPAGSRRVRIESRTGWPTTAGSSGYVVDFTAGTFAPEVPAFGKRGVLITGAVIHDHDSDTLRDPGDEPVAGQRVYIDRDNDGVLDAGEPIAITDSAGVYTFADQPAGTYSVRFDGDPAILRVPHPDKDWLATASGGKAVVAATTPGQTYATRDLFVARSITVTGRVFFDNNRDGVLSSKEPPPVGLGWAAYYDANGNGQFDATGEQSAKIGYDSGTFTLTGVRPGDGIVRVTHSNDVFGLQDAGAGVAYHQSASGGSTAVDVPLLKGTLRLSISFDGAPPASVSAGAFYFDVDDDGIKDTYEPDVAAAVDLPAGRYLIRALRNEWSGPATIGGDRWVVTLPAGEKRSHTFAFTEHVGSVDGRFFRDLNQDGVHQTDEEVPHWLSDSMPGFDVYLDANDNGRRDNGELVAERPPADLTQIDKRPFGYYLLRGLPAGTYTFRVVKPADQTLTTSASFRVTVKPDEFTAGAKVGVVWPY